MVPCAKQKRSEGLRASPSYSEPADHHRHLMGAEQHVRSPAAFTSAFEPLVRSVAMQLSAICLTCHSVPVCACAWVRVCVCACVCVCVYLSNLTSLLHTGPQGGA